jgi:hypothetical protein
MALDALVGGGVVFGAFREDFLVDVPERIDFAPGVEGLVPRDVADGTGVVAEFGAKFARDAHDRSF